MFSVYLLPLIVLIFTIMTSPSTFDLLSKYCYFLGTVIEHPVSLSDLPKGTQKTSKILRSEDNYNWVRETNLNELYKVVHPLRSSKELLSFNHTTESLFTPPILCDHTLPVCTRSPSLGISPRWSLFPSCFVGVHFRFYKVIHPIPLLNPCFSWWF